MQFLEREDRLHSTERVSVAHKFPVKNSISLEKGRANIETTFTTLNKEKRSTLTAVYGERL